MGIKIEKEATAGKSTGSSGQEPTFWSDVMNKDLSELLGWQKVRDKAKEDLYSELSLLFDSGVNLKNALEIVKEEQSDKYVKKVVQAVIDGLVQGKTFSAVLDDAGDFSDYEVFSIQIGEESGELGRILQELADYYRNKVQQKKLIVNIITYPSFVIVFSLLAIVFMMNFIVPLFESIFERFDEELPRLTTILIGISAAIRNNMLYFLLFIVASSTGFYLIKDHQKVKALLAKSSLKIPYIGDLILKWNMARFSRTMSFLLSANVPLSKSLDLIENMIDFYPLKIAIQDSKQAIVQGKPFHQCLEAHSIFPHRMMSLLKVGEEVNQLPGMFHKIAEQYKEELEFRVKNLSNVLEPIIIVILGFFIGIILIGMYLPLFKISTAF